MPTKAEIQDKLDNLEQDYRRLERAFNQAQLDINALEIEDHDYNTPAISFHAREAIKRAEVELNRVVVDPCDRINAYIRSAEGLGWSWVEPYTKNGEFAWCGAFASFCYTKVNSNIRKKIFPSCYRLYSNWAKTSRKIPIENVQAGDIVVIYTAKRSVQGDHITLCVDASTKKDGYIKTIEGNAKGELGNGEFGEGVIRQERELEKIAHVYRLLGSDFDE
jgi:hypothetical protein